MSSLNRQLMRKQAGYVTANLIGTLGVALGALLYSAGHWPAVVAALVVLLLRTAWHVWRGRQLRHDMVGNYRRADSGEYTDYLTRQ